MTPTHPTVTELLLPLSEIDDRGVYFEDSFTSWRDHIRHGAAIAAALRERLDPARPAGGVYHSGDLAYRDDAGYAYFAGRLGDWIRRWCPR